MSNHLLISTYFITNSRTNLPVLWSLCGLVIFCVVSCVSLSEVVLAPPCCDPALCDFNQSKTLGPQPFGIRLKMKNNEFLIAFCQ